MDTTWRVVSQTLQTELNPNGQGFHTVWQVRYQITSGPAQGTQGHVNVPADQFNADTVKQAIDAAVYHLNAVASL